MLHQIQHSEMIDGLKYEIIHEDHQQKAVDFFFEVFLKAECSTAMNRIQCQKRKWFQFYKK